MDDLQQQLNEQLQALKEAQNSLVRLANDAANAEYCYRVEKSKQVLLRRAEGMPVSLLSDVVKGDAKIAQLRLDADIKQSLYDAAKECINSSKFIARVLNEQIEREYRG